MRINKLEKSNNFKWNPKTHDEITKLAMKTSKRFQFKTSDMSVIMHNSHMSDGCLEDNAKRYRSYTNLFQAALADKKGFLEYTGLALNCLQQLTKPKSPSVFKKIFSSENSKDLTTMSKNYTQTMECPENLVDLFKETEEHASKTKDIQERFNIAVDASRMFIEKMFAANNTIL